MPDPRAQSELIAEALLGTLIEVFRGRGVDRLATPEAVAALAERLGRPVTANRLARTLGPAGVKRRQFRIGGRRVWGYAVGDLAGALVKNTPMPASKAPVAFRNEGGAGAAVVVEPPVPAAVATPEPSVGVVVQGHQDAEREWSWRLALAAVGR
jgi:hypothetical protein